MKINENQFLPLPILTSGLKGELIFSHFPFRRFRPAGRQGGVKVAEIVLLPF
jgi:hypothetical protein